MWSWFVNWGWGVISRSWFIRRSWGVVGRGFVDWLVGIITWFSCVCYFNNVSRVPISSVVLYMLGTAIGKDNAVFTIGRVTVTSFVGTKVNSSIFVSYSIFVLVFCWDISVSWLMVRWSMFGGMVRRSGFVRWGWLVDGSGLVDWSWMVNWGWFMVGLWSWEAWGMGNSMAVSNGMSMLNCSMAVNISIGSGQEGNKSDKGL